MHPAHDGGLQHQILCVMIEVYSDSSRCESLFGSGVVVHALTGTTNNENGQRRFAPRNSPLAPIFRLGK